MRLAIGHATLAATACLLRGFLLGILGIDLAKIRTAFFGGSLLGRFFSHGDKF
jgi:hypothetical protein